MAEAGLPRLPGEGPVDYQTRIEASRPDLARPAGGIIDLYVRLRYTRAAGKDDLALLRKRVRKFRPGRRAKMG